MADERPKATDRLADWLLSHVPFSTLTVLTMLIVSYRIDFDVPLSILAAAVLIDVGINATRWRRRVKAPAHAMPARRNATA